jgi:hypothetical protein
MALTTRFRVSNYDTPPTQEDLMSEQQPSDPPRPARGRLGDLSWSTDLTESGDEVGFGFTFGEVEELTEPAVDEPDSDVDTDAERDEMAGP